MYATRHTKSSRRETFADSRAGRVRRDTRRATIAAKRHWFELG